MSFLSFFIPPLKHFLTTPKKKNNLFFNLIYKLCSMWLPDKKLSGFEKIAKEYENLRSIRTVCLGSFRSIRSREGTFEQANIFHSLRTIPSRCWKMRQCLRSTRITCTLQTPVLTHTWTRLDASKWPPVSRNSGDTFAYLLTASFYCHIADRIL